MYNIGNKITKNTIKRHLGRHKFLSPFDYFNKQGEMRKWTRNHISINEEIYIWDPELGTNDLIDYANGYPLKWIDENKNFNTIYKLTKEQELTALKELNDNSENKILGIINKTLYDIETNDEKNHWEIIEVDI